MKNAPGDARQCDTGRVNGVRVACPRCRTFSTQPTKSLVTCSCGSMFVAIRVNELTENGARQHECLRYAQRIAHEGDFALHKLTPIMQHSDGSCLAHSCDWGAPYLLVSERDELDIFSHKSQRINIYPVSIARQPMLHATHWAWVMGIGRYGLLPKTYPGIGGGHGNHRTEKWLRFTGGSNAAEVHLQKYGSAGVILPIAYKGLILESCMDLTPWHLITLFEVIPDEVGCILMDEDGESYVFREDVPLPISWKDFPRYALRAIRRVITSRL